MHFIGSFSLKFVFLIFGIFIYSCEPFVTVFEDVEGASTYKASNFIEPSNHNNELKVMTWNIRFGAGKTPWFGDSCGDRVILSNSEVTSNLESIADYINAQNPDILLLQEVDVSSKRSGYIDQVQWLLNNTDFNYGVYASMWKADFIAFDGLGKVDAGNAILSKWPIENSQRIQLPLRGDQDGLTQYFYLRRNILKSKIVINDSIDFYSFCTHTTAFATDNTKQKHIDKFYDELSSIGSGDIFVAGGDLNALSSMYTSDNRDFCSQDKCVNDICDSDYKNNEIYQGSYFNHLDDEESLLDPLYDSFFSAIDKSLTNSHEHYTHSTWVYDEEYIDFNGDSLHIDGDDGPYNRKLDYIFSSHYLRDGKTHNDAFSLSDHAPVSGILVIP